MKTKGNSIFLVTFIVLLMVTSFIMGRISVLGTRDKEIKVLSATAIRSTIPESDIIIRASSRGTKYYFPWCVSGFNEENTIYFSSEEEALTANYEIASDCLHPDN